MVKLSFHGDDRGVTGSCHLVECNGSYILIDCGLYQGGHELLVLEESSGMPHRKIHRARYMPQAARMINTGSPECCTTLSVTLPNTQRLIPERPWVHMAIKLSGVWRPILMISSAP
jgi:hypothetical protein